MVAQDGSVGVGLVVRSEIIIARESGSAYQQGGANFITWDEANSGNGPIGMIVLSPYAKAHGYSNRVAYTHGSTLRTVQEIFSLKPFLGDASHSNDLRDLFTVFP